MFARRIGEDLRRALDYRDRTAISSRKRCGVGSQLSQPWVVRPVGLVIGFLSGALLVQAADPGSAVSGPMALRRTEPEFLVRAEVNHPTQQYHEGDTFHVRVVSEVDSYVYVVHQRPNGELFQIFPNVHQPDNRLKAKQAVQIPARDDSFRWQIGPPFGKELIKVIASKDPIQLLSDKSLREQHVNPISRAQFKGVGQELGANWSEVETSITTMPRDQATDAAGVRRFAVFFGVSEHKFNAAVEAATGKSSNLPSPHRNARRAQEIFSEVGLMNDTRLFINEQATRENLKYAVTDWLPTVSRPGDTVVIFVASHGMVSPGPPQEYFLVPYDFLQIDGWSGLKKLQAAGKLDAALLPDLQAVDRLVGQVGAGRAQETLLHTRGVSDVEFNHWLQQLDGRQIIVILSLCHSGGFAIHETNKDLGESENLPELHFLENQLGRLKDIGQPETALLASCSSHETSLSLAGGTGVMPTALFNCLLNTPGTVSLEKAYEGTRLGVQQYYDQHKIDTAASKAGLPRLFNYCSRPAYLKP